MKGSRIRLIRKIVARAVPINLPFFDEWKIWFNSKVGRSDLVSLSFAAGILIWFRYAEVSFDNFYHFITTSFELEDNNNNNNNNNDNTTKFFESLIKHLPSFFSSTIITHSTLTVYIVYFLLFLSFLLFSSPIYQIRYIRNKSFSGYSFLVYFIYCWLFLSILSHLPIIHQLVEEPLSLFPYFYVLTVITISVINTILRITLNRIFVFHMGTRKRIFEVLQSSAFIALACSTLYSNCGNTLNTSNQSNNDNNSDNDFCHQLFKTVTYNYNDTPPVLTMWLTGVTLMCVNYFIEGTASDRFIFFSTQDLHPITEYIEHEVIEETINEQTDGMDISDIDGDIHIKQKRFNSMNTSPDPSCTSPIKKKIDLNDEKYVNSDNEDEKLNELLQTPSSSSSVTSVLESNSTHSIQQTNSFETPQTPKMVDNSSKELVTKSKTIIRRIRGSAEPQNIHEMTSWFAMSTGWLLLDTVIAMGIFLDRYDRRALNAAFLQTFQHKKRKKKKQLYDHNSPLIDKSVKLSSIEQSASSCFTYLQNEKELWFDFMADCGDGFNPSYEIARLLAQPYLLGPNDTKLQRGKLLLIGGDLAYPGPTIDNYERKLCRVFQDAMQPPPEFDPSEIACCKPEIPSNDSLESYQGPSCLIIPGNHDWYDGLQTFSRLICSRNWLGGWLLPQTSTYFCSKLPHNWWIFAADYSLGGDIDTNQFQYFAKIVELYFDNKIRNERIIIITHLPDWIVNSHEHTSHGKNLEYLINKIIGKDRLRLRLAGDIHNYTRHESKISIKHGLKSNMIQKKNENPNLSQKDIKFNHKKIPTNYNVNRPLSDIDCTLIVSGGGGAFLHPTHVPGAKSISVNGILYDRVSSYPSIIDSRKYAIWNVFGFRVRNLQFDLLGSISYYLMVSSLFPLCNLGINSHIEELTFFRIISKFCEIFIQATFEIFERSYISISTFICAFIGFYIWTEQHLSKKKRIIIAVIHLLTHYIASVTVIILMEMIIETAIENDLIGNKTAFDIFSTHFIQTFSILQHVDNYYTKGYLTKILKIIFTVTDITGFHVSLRKLICNSKYKQIQSLLSDITVNNLTTLANISNNISRFHRSLYHITAFLFYYIFVAPLVSFIIGLYLFISSSFYGKYDEAFSSLRLQRHKNFIKFNLKQDGSLMCYVIGIDRVPKRWRQDPKWNGRGTLLSIPVNNNNNDNDNDNDIKSELIDCLCNKIKITPKFKKNILKNDKNIVNLRDKRYLGPSYKWNYPSRWITYNSKKGNNNLNGKYDYRRVKVIDQFILH